MALLNHYSIIPYFDQFGHRSFTLFSMVKILIGRIGEARPASAAAEHASHGFVETGGVSDTNRKCYSPVKSEPELAADDYDNSSNQS